MRQQVNLWIKKEGKERKARNTTPFINCNDDDTVYTYFQTHQNMYIRRVHFLCMKHTSVKLGRKRNIGISQFSFPPQNSYLFPISKSSKQVMTQSREGKLSEEPSCSRARDALFHFQNFSAHLTHNEWAIKLKWRLILPTHQKECGPVRIIITQVETCCAVPHETNTHTF